MGIGRTWVSKMLSFLITILVSVPGEASTSGLQARAVESEAICISSFSWMNNSLSQSPCLVAGFLEAACAGGDWNVSATDANHHYTPPNATDANGCRCSWAVYNTLQACADCQGQNFQSAMLSWSGYNALCNATFLSATDYYPPETPIPEETAIPFWATTDPSTWHDGIFDPSNAESIANQNNKDITQSNRFSDNGGKSSTNVGAIVGGVVGGLAGLAILCLLAWWCIRRRRRTPTSRRSWASSSRGFSYFTHSRGASDDTQKNTTLATPSPMPTMDNVGSYGRPPYPSMHSSNSFTSGAPTFTTPSSYMLNTQPPKQVLHYPPGIANMVALNQSNTAVSSANATVHGGGGIVPGHGHSLSNGSTASSGGVPMSMSHDRALSIGSTGDQMEGSISPFILPPARAEPMDEGLRPETPSSKGRAPGSPEPLMSVTRKIERRNPPAYFDTLVDGSAREGVAPSDAGDTAAAQVADSSLSGTTLRQNSGPTSGTQVGSSVAGGGGPSSGAERDHHGYPIDRKA